MQQFSIVWLVVHQVRTLLLNSKIIFFYFISYFSTPAVLILRSGISRNGDYPLSGTLTFLSWVNTEKNCSFNVSAFSLSVVRSLV